MNRIHFLRTFFVILVVLFANALNVQAADYYVDQKNPIANDQNIGTIDQPWKTIVKANQTLIAGDSLYIKNGTYTSYIAPINSGTATKSITYRNFGNDNVMISNTTYGILLSGKTYITVQGINFSNLDQFLKIQNSANHNTIAYCNFDQGRNMGWSGSAIGLNSSYNWVHHCRFSNYGYYDSNARGSVLDIGEEESQTDATSHNLIENNTIFHGGHHVIGIYGKYNVIRNNYLHNEAWSNGYGERVVYMNGYAINSGWNLVEGNQIGYSDIPPANPGSSGMQISNGNNIIRRNRFYYNNLSGIAMSTTSNYINDIVYNMIYNNTFLHNGWNPPTGSWCPDAMCSAIGFAIYSGTWVITNNAIKNNLYYDHPQAYGYYKVNSSNQIYSGNWNGDTQGDPKFINAIKTPGNPMDSDVPDLHLMVGSPCINAGTYLTTITIANGSGKMFQVADARYFINGWGITGVQGDDIQLYGSSQRARISNIDYSTNTITVDRDLTWTQNQGVGLAYEGAGPDIGAFEFGQGQTPTIPGNLRVFY